MATLNIEGRKVKVDDSFLSLPPEQQNATVEEIAASFGAQPQVQAEAPQPAPEGGSFLDPLVGQGVLMGFGDEIKGAVRGAARAAGEYLSGGEFDFDARYQDERDRARDHLGAFRERNPIGSTALEIGGAVMAAPVLPAAKVAQGANWAARAAAGAKTGAAYGAAYGAGTGDSLEDRVERAAGGALMGGAAGGALGSVLGRGGPQKAPQTSVSAEAAERLGVSLPRAVASDSMAVQRAGSVVQNVPMAGNVLKNASEKAVTDLGDAAFSTAGGFAPHGVPTLDEAGRAASEGIENWITTRSKGDLDAAYSAVDQLINPSVTTPLQSTQRAVADIMARRQGAALKGDGGAVSAVSEAVSRPQGLTYEGVKTLRSSIGEMLKSGRLPADISEGELKRIYGSLTDDLRLSVEASGGKQALARFDVANAKAARTAQHRKDLNKLLGSKSDEGVFSAIQTAAGSTGTANIRILAKARAAMPPEQWDEVASGIIARMGRDAEGVFSPRRFITDYGKLSPAGKKVLFRSTGKGNLAQSLDDIAAVSSRFKQLERFSNPSGTGQTMLGAGAGAGLIADPVTTVGALIGGNVLARVLAQPATAKSMAQWSKLYEVAVTKPARGSVALLQRASQRFAADLSEHLGVQIDPRALYGSVGSYAEDDGERRIGMGNNQPRG